MKIDQKKFSNKHFFTFNEQYLNFAYENRTGSADLDTAYADIYRKRSIRVEENSWLRYVGILWCAIGLLGAVMKWGGVIWLPIGAACLIWYHFSKIKYTVMETDRSYIWIIQDAKHDEIIREITDRRKAQLLAWHGEINYENEPAKEIEKFQWLVEDGAMSKEEAETKIAKIRQHNVQLESPSLLN